MTREQRRLLKEAVDAARRGVLEHRFIPNGVCTYCGDRARKNSLACGSHADLLKLDPFIRGGHA